MHGEASSTSCVLLTLYLLIAYSTGPVQAWSQSTAFEFFPLYDGMERSYTVKRVCYQQLAIEPAPREDALYLGEVRLRVLSHETKQGGIVWNIRQETDLTLTVYRTPPTRITGVDTVRLIESDTGRHELQVSKINARASLAFPWNFPYLDGLRNNAEAVHLYRSYTGPPNYVFEDFKNVGAGGSMCRIRFVSNFGIDSIYTDRYTITNFAITYAFHARIIGPAVDTVYHGILHREDSTRRAIVDLGFALLPHYPNPVSSRTSVVFSVPRETHVRIIIQDLFGRHIATIADQDFPFGRHEAVFDATRLAGGMYFMRMEAEGNTRIRNVVVRK